MIFSIQKSYVLFHSILQKYIHDKRNVLSHLFQIIKIKSKNAVCYGSLPKGVLLLGDCIFQSRPFQKNVLDQEMVEPFTEIGKMELDKENYPERRTEETIKLKEMNKTGKNIKPDLKKNSFRNPYCCSFHYS
jgi:hypothetical protein